MTQFYRLCVIVFVFFSHSLLAEPFRIGVLQDLPYGMHQSQKVDIYLSSFPMHAKGHLAVLMLHGGTDKTDPSITGQKVSRWVRDGVIFSSANYRQAPFTKPMVQIRDAAKALALLQRKVKAWGGDPNKVIVMGYGAGAYLASLLTVSPSVVKEEGVSPWLGTIALSPIALDVVDTMEKKRSDKYDDWFGSDLAYWKAISPLHQVEHAQSPLLLVCSTLDSEEGCTPADEMKFAATPLEKHVDILNIRLADEFMSESLGKDNDYTVAVEGFINKLYRQQ